MSRAQRKARLKANRKFLRSIKKGSLFGQRKREAKRRAKRKMTELLLPPPESTPLYRWGAFVNAYINRNN
jgi:hypothetical protein